MKTLSGQAEKGNELLEKLAELQGYLDQAAELPKELVGETGQLVIDICRNGSYREGEEVFFPPEIIQARDFFKEGLRVVVYSISK